MISEWTLVLFTIFAFLAGMVCVFFIGAISIVLEYRAKKENRND
jgi:hypothetical protein